MTADALARTFRDEYGRAVATLVRQFGDIDLAEDSVQEAFVEAQSRWDRDGIPHSPGAWITVTARHKALDRVRRESTRGDRERRATLEVPPPDVGDAPAPDSIGDDRLRLIFTACHPVLAPESRMALTLRLLGGLDVPQIARGFLVSEAAMRKRITRAKRSLTEAKVRYEVPSAADLPARLESVLGVVYLMYTEGHSRTDGDGLVGRELTEEAMRLARLVVELSPEPEALGLLALLVLSESRAPARRGADGSVIPLAEQDRSLWLTDLAGEGRAMVLRCVETARPGPYQLQAAIAAVHSDAPTAGETDWAQILALYDQLMIAVPGDVVALNRAVALAEVRGPAAGLDAIARLNLPDYPHFHAVRGHLLRRIGKAAEASAAYEIAASLSGNMAQRAFLEQQRVQWGEGRSPPQ